MKKINILLMMAVGTTLIISGFGIFSNQVKEFLFQKEIGPPQKKFKIYETKIATIKA